MYGKDSSRRPWRNRTHDACNRHGVYSCFRGTRRLKLEISKMMILPINIIGGRRRDDHME